MHRIYSYVNKSLPDPEDTTETDSRWLFVILGTPRQWRAWALFSLRDFSQNVPDEFLLKDSC